MGVPGETEIDHVDFVKGIFKGQGSIFQVTVPGYGRLFSETGHQVADLAYNWSVQPGPERLLGTASRTPLRLLEFKVGRRHLA